MGYRIPDDVIEQIRRANPLEDVVSQYLSLKPSGRNLVGLCPFHPEKTPSFNVNLESQFFKCFGCQKAGTVIQFLQGIEGLDFPAALRFLADRAGIDLRLDDAPDRSEGERTRAALEWATRLYRDLLLEDPRGEAGRAYVRGRGIAEETAATFRLGFAPDEPGFLRERGRREGLPEEVLERAGLLAASDRGGPRYDFFRGRVIFPISDPQGRTIAFGGRTLDEERRPPKYLNSRESPLFQKGRTLYGLHEARPEVQRGREVILMEGYTDVMMSHQCGVRTAVAALGTALTRDHLEVLRRFADRAVLLFDGDEAGERATWRGLDLFLETDLGVRVLALGGGEDPCDFLLARGGEALRGRLASAREVFDFLWERLEARMAGAAPAERLQALTEILARVARLPDALRRDVWFRSIAERTGFDEESLRERTRRVPGRVPARAEAGAERAESAPDAGERAHAWLAGLLALRPDFREAFRQDVELREALDPAWSDVFDRLLRLPAGVGSVAEAVQGIPDAALAAKVLDGARLAEGHREPERVYEGCAASLRRRLAGRRIEALRGARAAAPDGPALEHNLRQTYEAHRAAAAAGPGGGDR